MQNIDFYERKNIIKLQPHMIRNNPNHFVREPVQLSKETDRNRKRASRMMFFISALCIISFTTGIGVGIKFAGGKEREIVDKETFNAMSGIGKKFSNMLEQKKSVQKKKTNIFPKSEYPYVLVLNKEYSLSESKEIANFLSKNGYTIILSRIEKNYRIYIGPYKTEKSAQQSKEKISSFKKYSLANNLMVIKR